MRSKMVIYKISYVKIKLDSKVTLTKTAKAKVDSEPPIKTANSAKRKRFEDVIDIGQGDDRLPGLSKMMTDVAMMPPILMTGLRSASYKTKKSDCNLTGDTLEMEILNHCDETTLRDFKPLCCNHGKGSVAGQLTPVEHN